MIKAEAPAPAGPSTEEPRAAQPQEMMAAQPPGYPPYPPQEMMAPPPGSAEGAPPPGYYPPHHMYPYPPPPYYGAPPPPQAPNGGPPPPPPPGSYPPPPAGWAPPPYYMPPYDPNNPQGGPPPPPYYDPYYPYPPPPHGAPIAIGAPEGQQAPPRPAAPAHPIPPSETQIVHQASPANLLPRKSKSVRRKKKMYSDFVGVTYNKTHAKFQACITHYRKQHYLGRYKLAVDAALAYDESARLLKGSSWKVNFPNREAYETAKAKELESLGQRKEGVDVAQSLAAVAMKVEEIANNVNRAPGMGWRAVGRPVPIHAGPRVGFALPPEGTGREVRPSLLHGNEAAMVNGSSLMVGGSQGKTPAALGVKGAAATPGGLSKVTPSPTLLFGDPPEGPQDSPPDSVKKQLHPPETPIPETPNVTKHVMGTASKGTPDSVIRPMVLSYRKGGAEAADGAAGDEREGAEGSPAKPGNGPPEPRAGAPPSKSANTSPAKGPLRFPVDPSPIKSGKKAGTPAAAAGRTRGSSTKKSPRPRPPIIQNGTLAAASALMDLFSPQGSPETDGGGD